ncbi:phenoloxidase-activating factor 2-like isoform X2 [Phymastichus coffea]|nr:phenoloxidase-activating factor 2-like [Phymastichus coffea]XP_058803747.1 phenoloxidase-activating factor 2-like isoform X2 [Phymastichus coffea]
MMKAIFGFMLVVSTCTASLMIRSERDAQTDYENSICECVPYYQCSAKGTANENGEGVIDIRVATSEENPTAGRRTCGHYLEVCCLPPDVNPVQPGVNGSNNGGNGGNNNDNTGNGNGHVNRGCGYRNPEGIGFRITGNNNNEAQFAEYPWMVAILESSSREKAYICGGSLIHRRVVLTAAHCVAEKSATSLIIRAGEWDTQTTNEGLPHQDRDVAVAVIHPNYRPGTLFNDFALLILDNVIELADNVEIICLPEANEIFDNSNCIATGWGKSEFGDEGKYQVILKAVQLPLVPRATCQNSLRNTRLGKYFKLDQSFICAGGIAGIDTCKGDGGSPLVCPLRYDPSRYTQAGIVAWGIGCGTDGVPGVYAHVSMVRPWIDQTLANYNIDVTSYSSGANNNYPPVQG